MATSVLDHIRAVEHQKVKVKTETLQKVKQTNSTSLGLITALLEMEASVSQLRAAPGPSKMRPAKFAAFAPYGRMMQDRIEDK